MGETERTARWRDVASDVVDAVYVLSLWVVLIVGIASQNWWLFAPAAFLLIYERMGDA